MSSFPEKREMKEEKEDVSEQQRDSSVLGNCVVKLQAPHFLPEDAAPLEFSGCSSIETLCLSRTQLTCVSESILKNTNLKYLYLEGNQISSLPDSMFVRLPSLQWLDLRNNLIAALPAGVGLHRSLKTLLLEGNPISELPPEMGNVITLRGLNLRNCPITFPPSDIVDQGVQGILQYLRSVMAQRRVSNRKTLPELPVVEKLQLSEPMESSVEEQDEEELEKFEELKHKMILLEEAELGWTAKGGRKTKPCLCPVGKSEKASTTASMVPGLQLFGPHHLKRPQEKKQAATKELREKQAALEERVKSQAALSKWRTEAKTSEYRQKRKKCGRHKKRQEVEACIKPDQEDSSDILLTRSAETRSAGELERQIRVQAEVIQDRHLNPRGSASEQMAAAERDLREMTKLHRHLLENRNRGQDHGKCFKIFSGDNWTFPQ